MAQHDYNLANQSGADFRADLNNALSAIATVNSGATAPSTTFAHQLWVDTSSSVLKIRNSANDAWVTTGVSITADNTFTGNLTGNVTGNLTGNVTGNVTGDVSGSASTADTLSTARTIALAGDVAGSASFDGSGDITITTTAQIDSIVLGTDTTGDYVQSITSGTGVIVTSGTGEGSTPTIAIGQAVATTDDVTFNTITATDEFVGDIDGGVRFSAKADGALSKGDIVYISGVTGNNPTVGQAKADDTSKMPAFGFALNDANDNAALQVVTFGTISGLDTSNVSVGQVLYVSTTAGAYTTTAPTGETAQIQNIGKVQRSHASVGSIKVGGAGRANATPNLDNGKIFLGNGSNQSATSTLDTSIIPENTNLYYTDARVESYIDANGITLPDNIKAQFGASNDLEIYHDGSNSYVKDTGTGDLIVQAGDDLKLQSGTGENYLIASSDAGVQIYHDNSKKVETTASGINITGDANFNDGYKAVFGSSSDLEIYHDGSNSYITDTGTGDLLITGNLTGDVTGTVSSLSNHDTADLAEGTNLYYTSARFDSAFSGKSTSDLSEGTNLYYTDARSRAAISATGDISYNSTTGVISFTAGTAPVTSVFGRTGAVVATSGDYTTAQVTESGNLYYTDARANSAFDTRLATKDTANLTEGTNLYYTDARVQAVSINNVSEDATPQLGGDLDLNSSDITGTGNVNITGTIQSSGNITGTLATAAQPNITSVGTLTGFTSTGIDDNASSNAVTISSSGEFGIGVAPSRELHLKASNPRFRIEDSDGGYSEISANGGHLSLQADVGNTQGGSRTDFEIDGGSQMRLTATGLGIGTTSISQKLVVSGNATISGSLSKGSGSFKIDHPLESKKDTHNLVHSFVEAPQADNIYRGKVDLVNGTASVNIDEAVGMTEGTFIALNRELQVFTSNETDWDAVKGIVIGNILTITSQNTESDANVSWLVIGERQDDHIYETYLTDKEGKIIVEPLKE